MSIYDKASLVLIPSGTKTSKVYSQKPVNGDGDFTFSRSTAATRVNADGNIEKETQNLFLQSNTFSNASWTKTNSSVTAGQSGYDGSSDAWKLQATAASTCIVRQFIDTSSSVSTFSFYAKAGTTNWTYVNCVSVTAFFNLSNGTTGYVNSAAIDASITDVGSGWYRISLTGSGMTQQRIYTAPSNNNSVSAIGDNIYIQDAQLEQGLVARDYIETTTAAVEGGITDNVPRLDYTDSSCPALLLEPQRTNLITQSEYFESWNQQNAIAVNTNNDLSPEGLQNATELDGFDASNFQSVSQYLTLSDGTYTFSVFLKKTTGALNHYPAVVMGSTYKYVIVNSTTGTYAEATGTNDNDSVIIESWDANWWRVIVTNTMSAGFLRFSIYPSLSSSGTGITPSAAGANVFYGAQVEAGSYPTSYIPTYGTSVTRNVDGYNNTTGISGLLGSTTGTFFVDMERFNTEARDSAGGQFELRSSDGQTELNIDIENGGSTRAFYRDGGSFNFIYQSSVLRGKFCFVYNGANLKLYHNGVKQFDSNALSSQDFSQLIYTGVDGAKKHHQIMIFPTALTDQEAIDLTTI